MISLGSQIDVSNLTQADSFRRRLCSFFVIALLFFAASLLNSRIPGVGEPHYLSKAKAFANPAWCSGDFFLTSSNAHYVFYVLVGPLTKIASLETVALIGRAIQFLLLAAGWTMLSGTIGLSLQRQIWSAALFVLVSMLGNFSGEWLIGGFESKVSAWGFCLMSIHFWIHGLQQSSMKHSLFQSGVGGLCCGVAFSLHPVVGAWMAICVLMVSTYRVIRSSQHDRGAMFVVLPLLVFLGTTTLATMPGLLPALKLVFDNSLPKSQKELANFCQVFWRLKHHLDPMEFTVWQWGYAVVCSTVAFRLFKRNAATQPMLNSSLRVVLQIVIASAVIAFAGILIGFHLGPAKAMAGWEWRATLLKFYPFRMFDALLPMTVAWLGASVDQSNRAISFRTIALTITMALTFSWFSSNSAPPGYNQEQFEDWKLACDWIRQNTPSDSLILTPRESFAFKWYSDRAEFVCYKDCPQDAVGILEWNKRLWMLHDWTLNSSMDGQYNDSDVKTARSMTNCDYIVTRILGPFESPPIWQGKHWRVYRIPQKQPGL